MSTSADGSIQVDVQPEPSCPVRLEPPVLPWVASPGRLAGTNKMHLHQPRPGATQCSECWGWADDPRHEPFELDEAEGSDAEEGD